MNLIRHAETLPNTDPRALGQLRTDIDSGKVGPGTATKPFATTEPDDR